MLYQQVVSVPLRGLWFLSRRPFLQQLKRLLFPSPYGDYGSYRTVHFRVLHMEPEVSVPLRGLWFLSEHVDMCYITGLRAFPSPYGDYGSYRVAMDLASRQIRESFRPLTGIMVLIEVKL